MAKGTFGWFDLFGVASAKKSTHYHVTYRCFCGGTFSLRKICRTEEENVSSAFDTLPEHQQGDGARCPHSGEHPRFDPRPQERTKFSPIVIDRKTARDKIVNHLCRTADLFGLSDLPIAAE